MLAKFSRRILGRSISPCVAAASWGSRSSILCGDQGIPLVTTSCPSSTFSLTSSSVCAISDADNPATGFRAWADKGLCVSRSNAETRRQSRTNADAYRHQTERVSRYTVSGGTGHKRLSCHSRRSLSLGICRGVRSTLGRY